MPNSVPASAPDLSLPALYYCAPAQDSGYGDVDFWLFNNQFVLRPPDPRQWAEMGIRCRSSRCPDCESGLWSGAVGGFSSVLGDEYNNIPQPPFGEKEGSSQIVNLAYGELYTIGPHFLTEGIKVFCYGIGATPEIQWLDANISGLVCWDTPCIEDLEGIGLDMGGNWGLLSLSLGTGTGASKCISLGISNPKFAEKLEDLFKSKSYFIQGCRLETLSEP
jgi:hypothetical protein